MAGAERQIPQELLNTLSEVVQFDAARNAQLHQEELHRKEVSKIYDKADATLRSFGMMKQTSVGVGSGGRTVGMHMEQVGYLQTPWVNAETEEGETVGLSLSQVLRGRNVEGVSILFRKGTKGEGRYIYKLDRSTARNWDLAEVDDLESIQSALSFIEGSLREDHSPRESNSWAAIDRPRNPRNPRTNP